MRFGGHTAVCAFAFLLIAQARAQTVEVAPFLDNKQAALSITFDDGLLEHYIVAYPLLRDLGLHATFGLIGSRVGGVSNGKYKNIPCMTWVQAKEMAEHGQEITNHGYAHKNLSLLNLDSMRSEVQRNDTLIYHLTGFFPRTFLYPGNRKSDAAVAFCSQDRTCTRTYQVSLGGDRTIEWFEDYVLGLLQNRAWGVTMTHGIAIGYDHFNDTTAFYNIMHYAASMRHRLWVAPLRDIGAYVTERDSIHLKVKFKKKRIIVHLQLSLDPSIFNQPLTLLVDGKPYTINPYSRKIIIKRENDL